MNILIENSAPGGSGGGCPPQLFSPAGGIFFELGHFPLYFPLMREKKTSIGLGARTRPSFWTKLGLKLSDRTTNWLPKTGFQTTSVRVQSRAFRFIKVSCTPLSLTGSLLAREYTFVSPLKCAFCMVCALARWTRMNRALGANGGFRVCLCRRLRWISGRFRFSSYPPRSCLA